MHRYQWFHDIQNEAEASKDVEMNELLTLMKSAQDSRIDDDIEQKLAIHRQAQAIAERLEQPWIVKICQQDQIIVLLYEKGDVTAALDLAVRVSLDLRKPIFKDFPQRPYILLEIAICYGFNDYWAYRNEMANLVKLLEAERCDDLYFQYRILSAKEAAMSEEEDEQVVEVCWQLLQMADLMDYDEYQLQAAYKLGLALLNFERNKFQEIYPAIASNALSLPAAKIRHSLRLEIEAMQVLILQMNEQHERAIEKYERVAAQARKHEIVLKDAAIEFFLLREEPRKALAICQRQILRSHRYKKPSNILEWRRSKLQLLAKMGADTSRERERYLKVASGLKSRKHWEQRLSELELQKT